jgi:hypothetical protein
MKKTVLFLFFFIGLSILNIQYSFAQCSICTKTAEQMGEGPAKALNGAIMYLMFIPYLIIGYISYRWWKREKQIITEERL